MHNQIKTNVSHYSNFYHMGHPSFFVGRTDHSPYQITDQNTKLSTRSHQTTRENQLPTKPTMLILFKNQKVMTFERIKKCGFPFSRQRVGTALKGGLEREEKQETISREAWETHYHDAMLKTKASYIYTIRINGKEKEVWGTKCWIPSHFFSLTLELRQISMEVGIVLSLQSLLFHSHHHCAKSVPSGASNFSLSVFVFTLWMEPQLKKVETGTPRREKNKTKQNKQ